MTHKLFKLMEEVVLVNNTLYHRCTQLGNFPRPNYVMKYSNRDLLAKVTKNFLIFDSWLLKATLPIRIKIPRLLVYLKSILNKRIPQILTKIEACHVNIGLFP